MSIRDFDFSYVIKDYDQHVHSTIDFGSFSMAWPLVAFGDAKNSIYIINCFHKEIIYRVEIPHDEKSNVQVAQTYITDNF